MWGCLASFVQKNAKPNAAGVPADSGDADEEEKDYEED
jgi:hypothetical protein